MFLISLAGNNMLSAIVLFIVGLICIVKGGDWFVDAATWIAEKTGIPKLIIGATIVSFATTLPELIVSILSAAEGHSYLVSGETTLALESVSMSIGNATGSVIANTGLIMALSLIFIPITIDRKQYWFKPTLLCLITLSLFLFTVFDGDLKVWEGIIMLLFLVAFFWDNIASALKQKNIDTAEPIEEVSEPQNEDTTKKISWFNRHQTFKNVLLFLIGAVGIVVGARLLVDNGSFIATSLGVPARIIAITMVAIGTSLPELVTAITSIVKKQSSLSVGNILGANIIDTVLILPVCSLVYGGVLPVAVKSITIDCITMLCVTVLAFLPALINGRFKRWQGVALLLIYAAYLTVSIILV